MLEIPQRVVQILVRGLSAEIIHQLAIADEVGDDWPDWFDRNDAVIFASYRDWLLEHPAGEPVIEDKVNAKPVKFVMELLPRFVEEQRTELADADFVAAQRLFARWVALHGQYLLDLGGLWHSAETHPLGPLLQKLADFPK